MSKRRELGLISSLVTICLPLFVACGGSGAVAPATDGAGGDVGLGGTSGLGSGGDGLGGGSPTAGAGSTVGGSPSSGGANSTGGAIATGGLPSAGGNSSATGTGGAPSTGGSSTRATGGSPTIGGTTSGSVTGGSKSTGGTTAGGTAAGGAAAGGTKATGGASYVGGNSATGGATTSTSCTEPPAAPALVGYGAGTTGGGNATPVTVTSLSALEAAVSGSGAAVVYVKGVLSAGKLTVGSNKTIAGVCGAEIHGHVELSGSTNVIIRNIKIVGYAVGNCALDPDYDSSVGCSSGNDAMSIQKNASKIWIDHCDISDGTDGNMDITNGANNVTVSYTKFHYTPRTDTTGSDSTGAAGHRYSNLIGGTDSPSSYDDANTLNITWHHNWWADNVMERQPRVRFGHNHLFNNYWSSAGDNYCIRAGISAHILVQNNVFQGVKNPQAFNSTSDQATAYITASGNQYNSCSGTEATGGGGTAFTSPPYTVTPDAVTSVAAAVQSGAGPK